MSASDLHAITRSSRDNKLFLFFFFLLLYNTFSPLFPHCTRIHSCFTPLHLFSQIRKREDNTPGSASSTSPSKKRKLRRGRERPTVTARSGACVRRLLRCPFISIYVYIYILIYRYKYTYVYMYKYINI